MYELIIKKGSQRFFSVNSYHILEHILEVDIRDKHMVV
jgi:hypothetical protein